ncbi:MAG: glycosyltransferase family 2 protein [Deltaproteobacteria bacterium]|nr:glycosyltransferase family 2 protein [Deltaproteobacteria bacterium]
MTKLIIQIPCYNEAETLAVTLSCLPRQLPGIDVIEWLIIDDGCTDETVKVARDNGVDHIISHPRNLGLAKAFMTGLRSCVKLGADIIVNTDADNQYNAEDIPLLVQPILEKRAEIVIGARPITSIKHFSLLKKILQKNGSWVVRVASGTDIPDAPSGFRAISRDAAMQLHVFSKYTYTLETIIQAGQKNMEVISTPIRVNKDLRPSQLVKSTPSYINQAIITIIRIFVVYKPFRFFLSIAALFLTLGFLLGVRFLFFYLTGAGQGHVQSVVLSGVLLGIGFQTVLVAFLADIIAANRRLLEDVRYELKKKHSGK